MSLMSSERLVPTFRSSCFIAAPTVTNFGKSWALANILNLVPLYRSEVPDRTRRLQCGDFRSAVLAAVIAILAMGLAGARATDAVSEIRVDWATYNPVSLILKQKGMLEKEFAKDGIRIVWVQSAGSNKALEYLNGGSH